MVSIECTEAALITVAALIEQDPAFTPAFERLESELETARQTSTTETEIQSRAAFILRNAKTRSKPTSAKLSGKGISGGGKPGLRLEGGCAFLCVSHNPAVVIQFKPDQKLVTMARDKLRTFPEPLPAAFLALHMDSGLHRIAKSVGRYDRVVNEAAYNGYVG